MTRRCGGDLKSEISNCPAAPPARSAPAARTTSPARSALDLGSMGVSPVRRDRPRRRAFTLVELLVVVAIVALLLAILLPNLTSARAQAKRTACMANARSIATGWRTYLDENGGLFFQAENGHVNFGGCAGTQPQVPPAQAPPLHKPLNPYASAGLPTIAPADAAGVFRCPADAGSDAIVPTVYEAWGTSYFANMFLAAAAWIRVDPGDPPALPLAEARGRARNLRVDKIDMSHSEVLLAGDAGWLFAIDFVPKAPIDWHARRATHNLAFLDGHVAFTRIRRAIYVDSPAYTVIPFRDEAARVAALQQERP